MAQSGDKSVGRVNILLVDDQDANLLALEAVLEDLGQNLVHASSGEEALRRLQHDDFAVVLLDVQMHGLDGFETAKLIRSQERSRRTPIIFVTAYDSDRFPVDRAYSLGAVDYLVKPLVPIILRAKVAGFVELFQKTEQVKRQAELLRQVERREFDRTQQEQREWFRVTLASIGDAVITTDTEGRVTFLNTVAQSLTGWGQEEATGQPLDGVFRIIHEESRQPVESPTLRALRDGLVVGLANHSLLLAKDGTERVIDDNAALFCNEKGEVAGVVLVFRDMTARREAEAAVRASEVRYRRLFETAKDGILILIRRATGKLSLDLRSGLVPNPDNSSGEAFGSAGQVVGFDLTCLSAAINGHASHPRLLIHDSPREADLNELICRNLFCYVLSLEARFPDREPTFQYIITTTSPPPEIAKPEHICETLHDETPSGRLLGFEF